MAQIRDIKKRMVAVGTIARITKTMQMIATAKFTAAVQRAKATQPFTETIRKLVGDVAQAAGDIDHPLIDGPAVRANRELLLVISSDRGLCGAYNGNVLRMAMKHYRAMRDGGSEMHVETSGKKAVGFFKFAKIDLAHAHTLGDKPTYDDVDELATRFIAEFEGGAYDAVRVSYMKYVSNAQQVPEVLHLLPIEHSAEASASGKSGAANANYEFSPSSEAILAKLLPLSVKAQLFQAFNDAVVSEQIMRMVAMKSATENAKDLGKTLNRDFNRARQAQITTELTEIIGGTAALE